MKYLSHMLMATVVSTLAACGGGGGGGSEAPPGGASPPPAPVNSAPTISPMRSVSVAQDGVSDPIAFTVSDAESRSSALTLTAESSNQELMPNEAITIYGNDESRSLVLVPAGGVAGMASIMLMVTDLDGTSTRQSFEVTVTSEQRSFPEMVGSAMAKEEDTEGEQTVGYVWVDDPEEDDAAFDHLFIE